MIYFTSDYTTGAHPEILKRFLETNLIPASGYGEDIFSKSAEEKIRHACSCPCAQVYFATGGTQTNRLVISSMLKSYEGVVAAETGHINAHEAGAVENSGHKVLTVPQHMGKIDSCELEAFVKTFYGDDNHEHMVFPGMVYISHPTEYGSIYSKKELENIRKVCKKYKMTLFLDGARLGYALCAKESDLDLETIAKLTDVFYIGGTKVGALCGEAIVFTKNNMPEHFTAVAKQMGALVAKGRLNGLQFETLFTNGLYYENGRHAIEKKDRLVKILKDAGFEFFYESPTNQQFVIIDNEKLKKLSEYVDTAFWEKYDDDHTVVRFATSWSTSDEDLDELERVLKEVF
ncbi:MAG: aminotransferase class I/II-fold pyridoxal phosphate-dependent enzyme [Clostridia bacterium]|nr:aminotransferase class I/II-fold pyridoxal phosphate-dependent enzyme [Clostridia bacterium]